MAASPRMLGFRGALGLALVALTPGCAAGIAANAVGMAVRASQPQLSGDRRAAATQACTARAAPLGEVRIIDAVQQPSGRVTVWGTVERDGVRQSFECGYGSEVGKFRVRPISTD